MRKKRWAQDQPGCFSPDPALSAQSTLTDPWPGIANWQTGREWKSDGERAKLGPGQSGKVIVTQVPNVSRFELYPGQATYASHILPPNQTFLGPDDILFNNKILFCARHAQ